MRHIDGWPFPIASGDPDHPPPQRAPMFELETMTKTKLTEIGVLSQKNRDPDDNPGAALAFDMSASNELLTMFNGFLRGFLYHKLPTAGSDGDQARMDVEVNDLPNLTEAGQKLGKFHWNVKLPGYTLTIDHGLGGKKSDLLLEDCELSRFVFTPKEGGTVEMSFLVEAPDVPEKIYGKLPALKNREVQIKLTPPSIDDTQQGLDE
jgi:hypothetical protein